MKTYTATFADGDTKHRNATRVYTHGWRTRYSYVAPGETERCGAANYGFSPSAKEAHKASVRSRREAGPSAIKIIDREVVVVTSKEN